ncbi:hypothetical protein BKA70DRAFT_407841 [Coprinopsis sp. MPI-PUGE-AT-0042]|nr:hypothetical protein BKA70DRAFT_407841 [Coprinopsis sp. MPI-PUGE-AT-0042]
MAETLVSLNEVALERPAEPPFVDESWSAQLLDRTDSSRKAIIAAIFEALPTATTNLGHDDLPEKLLTICGSDAKLELMLQTEFMDGHSPIAWIILNVAESFLSGKDPKEVPPIFSMLLKSYGSPNAQLIQSIYSACCIRDSNPLLQLLDSHLAASDTFLRHAYCPQPLYFGMAQIEF